MTSWIYCRYQSTLCPQNPSSLVSLEGVVRLLSAGGHAGHARCAKCEDAQTSVTYCGAVSRGSAGHEREVCAQGKGSSEVGYEPYKYGHDVGDVNDGTSYGGVS